MKEAIQTQNGEDNQPVKISITLPTNAYFLSGIRDFTLSFIRNTTDFSEQWAYRFQSVVDELCNNAIEYGSQPGDEIRLTYTYFPNDSIVIEVEDSGTGENRLDSSGIKKLIEKNMKQGISLTDIRGRGLSKIVSQWTDELEFTDRPEGGIKVKAKKFLNDEKTKQLKQELSLAGDQTHIVI